jgi:hypothetical protein
MKKLYKRNDNTLSLVANPELYPPWLVSEEEEKDTVGNGFWFDGRHLEGMRATIAAEKGLYYHRPTHVEALASLYLHFPIPPSSLTNLGARDWRQLL